MALALTLVDNLDGTGGVATVAGSAGGSTNNLYYAAWTGEMLAGGVSKQYAWTLVGTRVGDGTIALASPGTLPLGYYQWLLVNVAGGVTTFAPLVYQNLTNAATKAQADQILDAVKTICLSLNLTGMPIANIRRSMMARLLQGGLDVGGVDPLPVMWICSIDAPTFPGGLTSTDDVGYPVLIAMLDKNNQDFTPADESRNRLWWEKVGKAFRWQQLPGVSRVVQVAQESLPQVLARGFTDANLWYSGMILRVVCRETRGLT